MDQTIENRVTSAPDAELQRQYWESRGYTLRSYTYENGYYVLKFEKTGEPVNPMPEEELRKKYQQLGEESRKKSQYAGIAEGFKPKEEVVSATTKNEPITVTGEYGKPSPELEKKIQEGYTWVGTRADRDAGKVEYYLLPSSLAQNLVYSDTKKPIASGIYEYQGKEFQVGYSEKTKMEAEPETEFEVEKRFISGLGEMEVYTRKSTGEQYIPIASSEKGTILQSLEDTIKISIEQKKEQNLKEEAERLYYSDSLKRAIMESPISYLGSTEKFGLLLSGNLDPEALKKANIKEIERKLELEMSGSSPIEILTESATSSPGFTIGSTILTSAGIGAGIGATTGLIGATRVGTTTAFKYGLPAALGVWSSYETYKTIEETETAASMAETPEEAAGIRGASYISLGSGLGAGTLTAIKAEKGIVSWLNERLSPTKVYALSRTEVSGEKITIESGGTIEPGITRIQQFKKESPDIYLFESWFKGKSTGDDVEIVKGNLYKITSRASKDVETSIRTSEMSTETGVPFYGRDSNDMLPRGLTAEMEKTPIKAIEEKISKIEDTARKSTTEQKITTEEGSTSISTGMSEYIGRKETPIGYSDFYSEKIGIIGTKDGKPYEAAIINQIEQITRTSKPRELQPQQTTQTQKEEIVKLPDFMFGEKQETTAATIETRPKELVETQKAIIESVTSIQKTQTKTLPKIFISKNPRERQARLTNELIYKTPMLNINASITKTGTETGTKTTTILIAEIEKTQQKEKLTEGIMVYAPEIQDITEKQTENVISTSPGVKLPKTSKPLKVSLPLPEKTEKSGKMQSIRFKMTRKQRRFKKKIIADPLARGLTVLEGKRPTEPKITREVESRAAFMIPTRQMQKKPTILYKKQLLR